MTNPLWTWSLLWGDIISTKCLLLSFTGLNEWSSLPYEFPLLKFINKLLSMETDLEEYNGFEEHESSYSGSDLLIIMGAGMICGALGVWYVRRNDKSLDY